MGSTQLDDRVGCDDKLRFQLELEFVQCLANPHYLNWLAQNRYFEDPAFINYLGYLKYWKRPEYAKYIIYPHSLFFLDLLQHKEFRSSIASTTARDLIHTQQFRFWQHYRANRIRQQQEETAKKEGEQEQEQTTAVTLQQQGGTSSGAGPTETTT